jgi:mannosyltransferase
MAWKAGPLGSSDGRVLAGLTVIGAGIRFLHLGQQSLWVDEAFSIKYARIFGPVVPSQILEDLHGPFHALLLHFWTRFFGTGETALRSMEAVVGVAAIPALYWALRPLGRRGPALLAVALLALSPFHLWYSQEVRGYALFILLAIVSTGLFLRLDRSSGRRWVLYTLCNLLAFLSNLAHLFTLAAQGWARLLRRAGPRPLWRGLLLSWAITLLLLSPWIVRFWERRVVESGALELGSPPATAPMRGETTAPLLGIPYAYFVYSVGYSLGPSLRALHGRISFDLFRPQLPILLLTAIAFSVTCLWGVLRLARLGPAGQLWIWLLVVPVLLTYGIALRNLKVFNPRYAAAAFPAYLVAVSEGVLAPRRRGLRWLLGAAVFVPTGVSLAQYNLVSDYWKDDARSAAAFLRAEARPGDAVFVIGTDEILQYYYWRGIRHGIDGVDHADAGYWMQSRPGEERRLFEDLVASHHRVFVLFIRDDFIDPQGEWRAYIRRSHPPVEEKSYTGAQVWVLQGEQP